LIALDSTITTELAFVFGFGFPASGTEGVGCWESDNLVCTRRKSQATWLQKIGQF
jgi:hypothetical protein